MTKYAYMSIVLKESKRILDTVPREDVSLADVYLPPRQTTSIAVQTDIWPARVVWYRFSLQICIKDGQAEYMTLWSIFKPTAHPAHYASMERFQSDISNRS